MKSKGSGKRTTTSLQKSPAWKSEEGSKAVLKQRDSTIHAQNMHPIQQLKARVGLEVEVIATPSHEEALAAAAAAAAAEEKALAAAASTAAAAAAISGIHAATSDLAEVPPKVMYEAPPFDGEAIAAAIVSTLEAEHEAEHRAAKDGHEAQHDAKPEKSSNFERGSYPLPPPPLPPLPESRKASPRQRASTRRSTRRPPSSPMPALPRASPPTWRRSLRRITSTRRRRMGTRRSTTLSPKSLTSKADTLYSNKNPRISIS